MTLTKEDRTDRTLSILEAALLWCGKSPVTTLPGQTFGWVKILRRDDDVYSQVWELLKAIENGELAAEVKLRVTNVPPPFANELQGLPGNLNPHQTVVTERQLAEYVISQNKDMPWFLEGAAPDFTTRTGAAGRPSKSIDLLRTELNRRADRGVLAEKLSAECGQLLDWLRRTHPGAAQPKLKTIENRLRTDYRAAVNRKPSQQPPKS